MLGYLLQSDFFFDFCTYSTFWLVSCLWSSRRVSPVGAQITESLIFSSRGTLSQLELLGKDFVLYTGSLLKIIVFSSQRFRPPASRCHSGRRARGESYRKITKSLTRSHQNLTTTDLSDFCQMGTSRCQTENCHGILRANASLSRYKLLKFRFRTSKMTMADAHLVWFSELVAAAESSLSTGDNEE